MAIRYTKQQKASPYFQQYKNERARLQRFARSAKVRGIELPKDFVPKVPQKITEGSVRKLQRITPEHGYYEKATFRGVNRLTGEVIESKRGTATSINRAIARFKESIIEALEPTEPLSKRRIKEITESFSKPDLFSTARHKSMLRQIESKSTTEELEETLRKIEKAEPTIDEEESYSDYWESLTPEQRELEYEDAERYEERQKKVEQAEAEERESEYNETLAEIERLKQKLRELEQNVDSEDFTVVDSDLSIEDTPFGNSINLDEQARKLGDAMSQVVSYVEQNVNSYWASKLQQAFDNLKSEYGSDPRFLSLAEDRELWENVGAMVEGRYGSGEAFPTALVRGIIEERLTGNPPSMEDNARLNDFQFSEAGDSFDI